MLMPLFTKAKTPAYSRHVTVQPANAGEVLHEQLDDLLTHAQKCKGCEDCDRLEVVAERLMRPFWEGSYWAGMAQKKAAGK